MIPQQCAFWRALFANLKRLTLAKSMATNPQHIAAFTTGRTSLKCPRLNRFASPLLPWPGANSMPTSSITTAVTVAVSSAVDGVREVGEDFTTLPNGSASKRRTQRPHRTSEHRARHNAPIDHHAPHGATPGLRHPQTLDFTPTNSGEEPHFDLAQCVKTNSHLVTWRCKGGF